VILVNQRKKLNMSKHIEKTLVLLKPDAVERGIIGRILTRFEDAGFNIAGMKLVRPSEKDALNHYTEDIAKRHGQHMRDYNINFITSGPVVALVIEGVNAIENVRKFCGTTEPKSAAPGTIRGDFSHMSYGHADEKMHVAKNVVHASDGPDSAKQEIKVWFTDSEIIDYQNVHAKHTR
jgi:nucleoside-diphosphate kinase